MRNLLTLAALLWAALFAPVLQAAPDFPPLSGRVVDQAKLLSTQAVNELTALLAQHEEATGNQVVVVTLSSLGGYEIADYGYQLGRHWGIGQQGKDNGVLLIVAPNERKVRIEVGYGLEGTLTDALSKNIIETVITPRFKQKDMPGGIVAGSKAILAVLDGNYEPQPQASAGDSDFNLLVAVAFFTFIIGDVVRRFFGNRLLASAVMGGAALLLGLILYSLAVGVIFGVVVFVLQLLNGVGRALNGLYGGGGGRHSSGGGGFSGGGGSFGGGGASGGW